MQRFLMMLRQIGVAVLMVHHANKKGLQRGSSRREDVLDLVMALHRPAGYQPRDGARFEIHFEKARSLHGATLEPIEAHLQADAADGVRWRWRPASDDPIDKAVRMLGEGLSVERMGKALCVSRASAYRLRSRARELGRLPDRDETEDET